MKSVSTQIVFILALSVLCCIGCSSSKNPVEPDESLRTCQSFPSEIVIFDNAYKDIDLSALGKLDTSGAYSGDPQLINGEYWCSE
ncbi:MAG: hypothetical protein ABIC40_07865, partial [bacterium]